MQYYYDIELCSVPGPKLTFGEDHHREFKEATEFAALADSNPGAKTMQRIKQIRKIFH